MLCYYIVSMVNMPLRDATISLRFCQMINKRCKNYDHKTHFVNKRTKKKRQENKKKEIEETNNHDESIGRLPALLLCTKSILSRRVSGGQKKIAILMNGHEHQARNDTLVHIPTVQAVNMINSHCKLYEYIRIRASFLTIIVIL